jgi:hypothetical protein
MAARTSDRRPALSRRGVGLDQSQHEIADQQRRLIARDEQLQGHVEQLGEGQPPPVDLGGDELEEQIRHRDARRLRAALIRSPSARCRTV